MVNSGLRIKTPLSEGDVLKFKVGDIVLINGLIITGRDRVHKYLFREKPNKKEIPFELKGSIIYHCGPIITKIDNEYRLVAAGPTTSMRVELYEYDIIRRYGIRGIIGKGGMGEKTIEAMREFGCIYLHTISGASSYLADRIKRVSDVWKLDEFGEAEAMWLFDVEDFPAIVTIDVHGNSMHRDIEKASLENLKRLIIQVS